MPARKRRILVNDDGERIKRAIGNKKEYWSIESDGWFSVLIATDGEFWTVIEGATAILIPYDVMNLICETKQMYEEQIASGRHLQAYLGPTGERGKNERKIVVPLDEGKVRSLRKAGWSIDKILKEVRMDGTKTSREEIERVLKDGRD